jgi:hypothetical protein
MRDLDTTTKDRLTAPPSGSEECSLERGIARLCTEGFFIFVLSRARALDDPDSDPLSLAAKCGTYVQDPVKKKKLSRRCAPTVAIAERLGRLPSDTICY